MKLKLSATDPGTPATNGLVHWGLSVLIAVIALLMIFAIYRVVRQRRQ